MTLASGLLFIPGMKKPVKKPAPVITLDAAQLERVTGGETMFESWFTCLKSCADSKAQVQAELARFR